MKSAKDPGVCHVVLFM